MKERICIDENEHIIYIPYKGKEGKKDKEVENE